MAHIFHRLYECFDWVVCAGRVSLYEPMLRLHCSLKYNKAVLEAFFTINIHYSSTWKEDGCLMTCHLRFEREFARLTFYKTRITFSKCTAIKKCLYNGGGPSSRPLPEGRCRMTLQVSSNLSLHPVGSRVIYIHDTHCRAHSFITCIEIQLTLRERAPLLNFIHISTSQRLWMRLPNSRFLLFQRVPTTPIDGRLCLCLLKVIHLLFYDLSSDFSLKLGWFLKKNCALSIGLKYATFFS